MSAGLSFPRPVIDTGAYPENVPQSTGDPTFTAVASDDPNAIVIPSNPDGRAPPTPQAFEGSNLDGIRPPNIRKESSIAFNVGAAANSREPKAIPEPLTEGDDCAMELGNGSTANYTERTPRRLVGRKGTFDARSMVSTSSATTVAEAQTKYVNMLLALDHIHGINDILASVFCWLLLAGFVVLPGTIKKTIPDIVEVNVANEDLKKALNLVIEHVPLVAIAGAVSGIGLLGMVIMWIRWRGNYIWLVQNIFLPGCTNALAGLVSTLVSIFVLNKGKLDTLSKIILGIVSGVTGSNFLLIVWYQFIRIASLQRDHEQVVGKHSAGKTGAGRYRGIDDEFYAGGK